MTLSFRVARNPEPGSKLPYLLPVPVPDGPLILKAREPWPRTSKVSCHREDSWPSATSTGSPTSKSPSTCSRCRPATTA